MKKLFLVWLFVLAWGIAGAKDTSADDHAIISPSTIISLISLLVAAGTFFLTQLKAAKITSYVGPAANMGYPLTGGGFSLSFPVTLINRGSRTGAVLRSAVILWPKEWPEERYFMQWDSFVKENYVTRSLEIDEVAHALAIPGKSIVAKYISYGWPADSKGSIRLREATYCLSFLYWTDAGRPHHETHEIPITAEMVAMLNAPVDSTHSGAIKVTLDKKYKKTEVLNTYGYDNRLEGK